MPRSVTSPYRLSRTSVTARVIAIIVFLAGAVNIFSAWLGIDPARVRLLHVYPLLPGLLPGPHSSRTLTVLAGVLLMLLSSSLFWRKRQGWIAAVVLLTLSLVLHLLKGLDYEEATFTIVVLSVLIVARHEFVVRSDRRSFRSAALISVVMVAGSLCYGVLGYALLRPHFTPAFTLHRALDSTIVALIQTGSPALRPRQVVVKPAPVPRGHGSGHRAHANSAAPARPKIEADKDAVWFDDSLVGIAFISVLLIAGALLRPVAATLLEMESEREEVRRLLVEYGGATLGYWALLPGLSYLFLPSRRAVLAYRVEEHVALVLGDPIGDADAIPELIAMFDQLCLLNDWRPAWYQLTARWLPGMRAHGWAALKLGEEALIPLPALSFSGKAWQDVRTALHRLPREGCGALWYDLLSDPRGWIPELQAISQSWLDAHHGDERGFSQGTWETAIRYAEEQRVLVLVDGDGRPAAFLTFVPLFIEGGGWALDLMRRRHSLCPGAVEYLLAFALQSFQEEGVASVSLGLSALSDVTPSEAGSSPELVNRARALIFEHFDRLYNFKGLHQFKEKFQPEWEARFLVYPSLAQLPRVLLALIRAHTVVSSTRRPRVQLPVSNIMMVHACSGIASLSAGMARAWARTPWRRQSAGARDRLAGLGLGLPIAAAHGPSTAPALLHCGQLVEMILITLLSLWILLLLARHGRDVRAARRAARERRLPDIFAHAPQAILILDPVQHRLLEANPAAVQLLGYSQQALLELRYEDLVADAGDAVQSDIPADLSVGTPLAFTRTFRNCGGEEVSLKITGAVFPYQDTEALLMFLHDLTEFKHVDVRRDSERRRL